MSELEKLAEALKQAHTIAIVSHVNPDGDAIGSALAVRSALLRMGKQADHYCDDPVPGQMRFLAGWSETCMPEAAAGKHYDLLFSIDVADMKRMGRCVVLAEQADRVVQLDHHGTNPEYASINVVDGDAPAAGVIVYRLFNALCMEPNAEEAEALFTAISTDSGHYAFPSTTAESLEITATLMKTGFPMSEIHRRLYRQKARAQVFLTGKALNSLCFHGDGSVTSMCLRKQDFTECGALAEHADSIVNFGLEIENVCMTVLVRETDDGKVKCSLRAVLPYRVDGVARTFGGGGHALAAGCTLEGTLEDCLKQVLAVMAAEKAQVDENR